MLFVYFTRRFSNEECSFCLCTSRSVFRTRNTLVVCALHALFFQTRNTLIVCALYAVFLERGILLLFVHFTRNF